MITECPAQSEGAGSLPGVWAAVGRGLAGARSGNAVGKVQVSISQHMSQLPVLQQQGQQREPGG